MKDNEQRPRAPGEAEGDGKAAHGYRNEVSWDGGRGSQPYANQGAEETETGAAPETDGGDRGKASGRNLEQMEQVKGVPDNAPTSSPDGRYGEFSRKD